MEFREPRRWRTGAAALRTILSQDVVHEANYSLISLDPHPLNTGKILGSKTCEKRRYVGRNPTRSRWRMRRMPCRISKSGYVGENSKLFRSHLSLYGRSGISQLLGTTRTHHVANTSGGAGGWVYIHFQGSGTVFKGHTRTDCQMVKLQMHTRTTRFDHNHKSQSDKQIWERTVAGSHGMKEAFRKYSRLPAVNLEVSEV